MSKQFVVMSALACTFALAQASTVSHAAPSSEPYEMAPVLYSQMDGMTTKKLSSQDFEPANDRFDTQGADDFVVPDEILWTVHDISVFGFFRGGITPESFNIYFYENDPDDRPGALVALRPLQPYEGGVVADGDLATIHLDSPVALHAGIYWVSVQARLDGGQGTNQWYWNLRDPAANHLAQWRNPGGGINPTCTDWNNFADCLSIIGTDFLFELYGYATPDVDRIFCSGFEQEDCSP